jgi:site-specific DNA-methyltransferase (adenine-specific)
MLELNRIYNMDCMEGMKQFPDKYFELAIVDPPYGIGAGKEKPHNGWKDYGIKHWDNQSPDKAYFEELFRVSQNQIIWGANHFISKISRDFSCFIIWDKGQRNFSLADGEMAWTSFRKAARIFDYSRARALQEGKIHPTQKPVALYKWLLNNYAKKGDKILDTHLGSGSSVIACYDMQFEYIGFEIDKEYFDLANKRIERHKAQMNIFDFTKEAAHDTQTHLPPP